MSRRRRLIGTHIPTTEGREVLLRPALAGAGVQVAIIGKRGGLVEAFCIGLDHLTNYLAAFDGASELAWESHQRQALKETRAREKRHADALARNPWLNGSGAPWVEESYLGREPCEVGA